MLLRSGPAVLPRPATRNGSREIEALRCEVPQRPSDSRRLKIAYVHDGLYPYFKGGAERRFFKTAHSLAERHDVTYISWQYWDGPSRMTRSGVSYVGVGRTPGFYGTDGKRTIRESLDFARRVVGVLQQDKFDVIDCCATPLLALYVSRLVTRLRHEPLVVTWHEYWKDYWDTYLPHRPVVARVAKALESRAVPLADTIVAVSEFTADKLRSRAPNTPIRVVGNGVSLEEIDAVPAEQGAPCVVFAGRLIDDKKVDWLLQAVSEVTKTIPSLTCGIIGDGPERARLESLAGELELSSQVRFFGFVEEDRLYALLKGSKVFVLPSVREGFGMSVVEAQACSSVPIVVRAPYNAAATLLRNEVDGLICQPCPGSLADAIRRLLTDSKLRREMSKNARRSAEQREWSQIASQLEEIYTSVVASK